MALEPITDGLAEQLAHYGVEIEPTMVLDPQNEPFPMTVERDVGGFTMQEIQSFDYPYFVDVRSDGMGQESPIIANVPAVTLNWVSPVVAHGTGNEADDHTEAASEEVTEVVAEEAAGAVADPGREVVTLLESSPDAWTSPSPVIQPDGEAYPEFGFPPGEERGVQPLAVSVRGRFDSFFAGQPSPLEAAAAAGEIPAVSPATSAIDQSPESARLVVFGSGDFLNDTVFSISSQISFDRYLNSLQLLQNAVDWSVEDLDLLDIRARGSYARVLEPLETSEESFWEIINYGVVLLALLAIGLIWAARRRNETPMELVESEPDPSQEESSHEQA
ncbi:MAG: hypothetical protein HC802_01205 [Caldilineaceae bacterium]|nr:hypothetical protein [Caldilineaceae bacterium]